MKFAERFLVMLSLIGYFMVLAHMRDGVVIALLAMSALALFYLVCAYFLLRCVSTDTGNSLVQKNWQTGLGISAGIGFAYCIISLLLYTLQLLPAIDMVENSTIILFVLTAITLWKRKVLGRFFNRSLLVRAVLILVVISISALLHFPDSGINK